MILSLFTHSVYKLLKFLKDTPGFFEMNEADRVKALEAACEDLRATEKTIDKKVEEV